MSGIMHTHNYAPVNTVFSDTERYGSEVLHKMRRALSLLTALILTILLLPGACAAGEESSFVENEWNYVDGSMDVFHGIPATANGVLARIKERGVLRVATELHFAPQSFIDPALEGQVAYAGADMELARLIAQRMGVELVIVPMDYTEVLRAVSEDRCDLAIAALSYTPERAVSNELSKGYFYKKALSNITLVIREENAEKYQSVEDLENAILAAQRNSRQETVTIQNVLNYKEFRRLAQLADVYESVSSGKVDAGIVDIENTQVYIRNNPNCGLVLSDDIRFSLEQQFTGDRVAGKKGETELMYFVNGVIDEVTGSGKYSEWYQDARKRADELGL